ncbi:HEAT repeat domain-containing protein [Leptospira borgpetersenii serovar Tarassovi]|nr:HEAT repeat domain-containing protein [Leptospira borgpetersenii serovar Tarassovi]MBE8403545.1 HEAT repeat domain-containing protein [Leptospira borgpetersenii serovar Tarassovi]MBE8406710.1 HEAT repeat domain-containing protein [Leptospira borgpetersenii serovar Tarassovi]MBE8412838.1 HEAT repeat domain-containing protein [Leptospira borgpetersenii serovar Tarassovi]MBE8416197.1 HEAT repeat domain-containing protein [Leptospira borgpetersenii serovar Tarassovi]
MSSIAAAETLKDEFKENVLSFSKSQASAISEIRSKNRLDLVKELPSVFQNESVEEKAQIAILKLFAELDELDILAPNWVGVLDSVFQNTTNVTLRKEILLLTEKKKEKRLIYSVIAAFNDPETSIRALAYRLMYLLKDDRALPVLLDMSLSKDPLQRMYFLESSLIIKDERIQNQIHKLANDESSGVRKKYLIAINRLGITEKFSQFQKSATGDPDDDVKIVALEILKNKKNRQNISLFYKGLTDPNPDIRRISLEALLLFQDKQGAKVISDQLAKEENLFLKARMIDLLLDLGNHGGGQGILAVLTDGEEAELRTKAAYAVGKLGVNINSVELAKILSEEKEDAVKWQLIRSLGELKDKNAISGLLMFARNPREKLNLRIEAVITIRIINDPDSLSSIFEAYVSEREKTLRMELENTVREILNLKFPPKVP